MALNQQKKELAQQIMVVMVVAVFLLLGVCPHAEAANARSKAPLSLNLKGYWVTKAVDKSGKQKEILKPLPDKVLPGSIIEYEITAENTRKCCPAKNTLENVILIGIIPQGTVYIEKSATSKYPVEFSINGGGTFQKEPVKYKVKLADGKKVEKIATPDMYTHIRWTVPKIKPKQTVKLFYRVKVKGGQK